MSNNLLGSTVSPDSPKLLERVRSRLRLLHYSMRTELAYM